MADESLLAEARAAAERHDYKDALRRLNLAIHPVRLDDNAEGAEEIAREALRISETTQGRTRKRAIEVSQYASAAATQIRQSLARQETLARVANEPSTRLARKDVSPIAFAITVIGAAIMLIAVFLPRVESNTFLRVAQNTLIQSGGGWWFVGLAVAITGSAWFAYQSHDGNPGPLIAGLVGIGFAIYYGTAKASLTLCPVNSSAANALGIGCSKASPGIGIYAAGVGGVLAVLGGIQILRAPVAATDVPQAEGAPPADEVVTAAIVGDEIEERLGRLDALRDKGLVTDAEYQQRRAAILEQI